MSKAIDAEREAEEMPAEYDFSRFPKGVRGKYFQRMQEGHSVEIRREDGTIEVHHYHPLENSVVLDRDVRDFFSDAETVNRALRGLIALVPRVKQAQPDQPTEKPEQPVSA